MCLQCEAKKLNALPKPTRTLLAIMMLEFHRLQVALHEHGVSEEELLDAEVEQWQDIVQHAMLQSAHEGDILREMKG